MDESTALKEEKTAPQKASIDLKIKIAISIMSVSVPMLYLVGYFYDVGYLSVFDVSNDYFPRSFQQYLVSAFVAFLGMYGKLSKLFIENLSVFIAIGGLFALSALIGVLLHKYESTLKRKRKAILKHKIYPYILIPSFAGIAGFSLMYLVLIFVGALTLLPLAGFSLGIASATEAKSRFVSCKTEDDKIIRRKQACTHVFKKGELELSGLLVSSSKDYIAIFDGKKTNIHSRNGRTVQIVGKY